MNVYIATLFDGYKLHIYADSEADAYTQAGHHGKVTHMEYVGPAKCECGAPSAGSSCGDCYGR